MNDIKNLNNLVREVEDLLPDMKPFPYLGWFWRDIGNRIYSLSLHDDFLWIDEAGKWDYPPIEISERESDYIVKLLIGILKEQKILYTFLKHIREGYRDIQQNIKETN